MIESLKKHLYKANLALRGNALKNRRQLEEWQKLSAAESRELQDSRLKQLLNHANLHVPYYKRLFRECGITDVSGGVQLASFAQIPLLDKATMRDNYNALKSNDLEKRNWFENASGGSTGEPIRVVQDKVQRNWDHASTMLFNEWTGYRPGMRFVRLWGSERDLQVNNQPLRVRMGRWLRNELALNAYRIKPHQMDEYICKINSFKPQWILAYADSIYQLCLYIDNNNLPIHSPKAVVTSAGTLHPKMRQLIQRVFNAPVFNRYGSREVGSIACEIPHSEGLIVCLPTQVLEILRSDGSPANVGEVGEIVITSLTNYAMPLIRYRIGDMAAWSTRSTKIDNGWPVLQQVSGRVTDSFLMKDGTSVHGLFFNLPIFYKNWIHKYQIVQEDFDYVRVYLVVDNNISSPEITFSDDIIIIKSSICSMLGEDCHVDINFVDEISPTPSGKHRYLISKIKN